jgi:hypothetical protein
VHAVQVFGVIELSVATRRRRWRWRKRRTRHLSPYNAERVKQESYDPSEPVSSRDNENKETVKDEDDNVEINLEEEMQD